MPYYRSHTWTAALAALLATTLLLLPFSTVAADEVGNGAGARAAQIPSEPEDPSDVSHRDQTDDGSGSSVKNDVILRNHTDGRLRMRGAVMLARIPGSTAQPENFAYSLGSCTDCQTLTVALQIALISQDATTIAPQNVAIALNDHCTRCFTSARALQYVIQVEDPMQVPERATELVDRMDEELRAIQTDGDVSLPDAQARIDSVVRQFQDLGTNLKEQRKDTDEETSPDAPQARPAATPTPTNPAGPQQSTSPGATPTASPTPAATLTPTPHG